MFNHVKLLYSSYSSFNTRSVDYISSADGQISRMSQLPGLTEEEMELGIGSDDGRSSGLSTPEPTLDWDTDRPNQLRWVDMMTSWHGNTWLITGPLCEESTSHWRIALTKASNAEV